MAVVPDLFKIDMVRWSNVGQTKSLSTGMRKRKSPNERVTPKGTLTEMQTVSLYEVQEKFIILFSKIILLVG